MEHVNEWCFRDIYKGGLWEDDSDVCAPHEASGLSTRRHDVRANRHFRLDHSGTLICVTTDSDVAVNILHGFC